MVCVLWAVLSATDDGRRPKHVGANQSDFNVNFKTLSSLIKNAFVGVWTL